MVTMPCAPSERPGGIRAQRALQRLHAIQEAACRLVVERGYDGFTMDELAAAVGVSRRTLFNYVPDKASAVVGPFRDDGPAATALATFAKGGPTGALVDDLYAAIDTVVDDVDGAGQKSPAHHELLEAAVASDPKVLRIVTQRFEQVTAMLEEAVTTREGWPTGDLRARALAATTLALIKVTLEELSSTDAPGAEDFKTTFHTVLAADAAARSSR